jgi:neutral ceramidase
MLKAGTGRVDVSPRASMFLWGYPHVVRMSTGIHDPLYATALCLDDGSRRVVSIAVDILYVGAALVDDCRRRIAARTGIPGSHVLISATHTHSAPVTCMILAMIGDPVVPDADPAYVARLADGIVRAACDAAAALAPAELTVTTARVDGVGCNRHAPDAPRDPEVGVLAVRGQDGAVKAIQTIYAMHPTVMHEDSTLVSSDFPGFTRAAVEAAFPGAAMLYHNGPCGNLSPRYHVKGQTFEEAERLGRRLGAVVIDALHGLSDASYTAEATVAARQARARLTPRRFPSVDDAMAQLNAAVATYERLKREKAGHGPVRTAECTVFGAEEVVTMARAQAAGTLKAVQDAHLDAEVQVLRIGEVCLVGLPGELFVEYALDIKARAQGRAFVISMANGEVQGYITTPEAKGYEANLSMFTPPSGAALVDTALNLMKRITP